MEFDAVDTLLPLLLLCIDSDFFLVRFVDVGERSWLSSLRESFVPLCLPVVLFTRPLLATFFSLSSKLETKSQYSHNVLTSNSHIFTIHFTNFQYFACRCLISRKPVSGFHHFEKPSTLKFYATLLFKLHTGFWSYVLCELYT